MSRFVATSGGKIGRSRCDEHKSSIVEEFERPRGGMRAMFEIRAFLNIFFLPAPLVNTDKFIRKFVELDLASLL